MKIIVKEVPNESDLHDLVDLINKVFKNASRFEEYNTDRILKKISGSRANAIFEYRDENNSLVGFAIGYERYPKYYHVWELGVDSKMRGKGVATDIYNAVEKFAREKDFKGVSLNTFNEWKDNLRLVLKLGYKIYDLDKSAENVDEPKIMLKKSF